MSIYLPDLLQFVPEWLKKAAPHIQFVADAVTSKAVKFTLTRKF